jgi:hypothetical protein
MGKQIGMACLTTARLLFIDKGFLTVRLNQVEFRLAVIKQSRRREASAAKHWS